MSCNVKGVDCHTRHALTHVVYETRVCSRSQIWDTPKLMSKGQGTSMKMKNTFLMTKWDCFQFQHLKQVYTSTSRFSKSQKTKLLLNLIPYNNSRITSRALSDYNSQTTALLQMDVCHQSSITSNQYRFVKNIY